MERNSSLLNYNEMKDFIIQNKITGMKQNSKQKKTDNSCLNQYGDKK